MIACDNMALYLCHYVMFLEFILPVVLFVLPLLESQGHCCSRQAVLTAFQPIRTVSFFGRIYHYIPRNYHYCDLLWDSNPATVTRSVDPGQLPVTQVRWIAHRRSSDRAQWATPFRGLDWNGINFMASQNPQPFSVLGWVKNCPTNETITRASVRICQV